MKPREHSTGHSLQAGRAATAASVLAGALLSCALVLPSRVEAADDLEEKVPPTPAQAQGGAFVLDWHSFESGGRSAPAGTGPELAASLGQPEAAVAQSSNYSFQGGFWPVIQPQPAEIFADGFESGDTSAWSVTVP